MELNFNNYEIVKYEETPKTGQWALIPLYKLNQRDSTMYWQIGYNPYENKLISLSRQMVDAKGQPGKLRVSKIAVKMNKSGRDLQVQALLNARSKYHKKYQKNFRAEGEISSVFLPAQLSNDYIPPDKEKYNKENNQGSNITLSHLERGVAVQAKIDGIRARSWLLSDNNIVLLSRNNNEFLAPSHIKEELKNFFPFLYQTLTKYGYNNVKIGIDGELYNHDLEFEEITSIVRTEKTIHPKILALQYYIFDLIVEHMPSDHRIFILEETYKNFIANGYSKGYLIMLTTEIAHTYDYIDILYKHFLSLQFEGVMLRKTLGLKPLSQKEIEETYYKPERNDNLLKYKPVYTEEGIVMDMVPGEGKEEELAEILIKDIRGNIFRIHPSGSYEMRKEWLQNKYNYIGLPYTFKYGDLTENQVPRFPVGIGFRNYE